MTADFPLMAKARSALSTVFGFSDFRPGQEDVLSATLAGKDVLAVMPTGSGKSLCFQLPAIVRSGLTLVVSPLIALMRDQVAQLRELGVEAASLNSSSDADERRRAARGLDDRSLRLLYIAPERLLRDDIVAALGNVPIDLLAIDEAHCVSQWGHDFRPEYLRLREVAEAFHGVQTIAVTATADAPTRAEIAARLFVRPPEVFVRSFDRPNLFLAMRPKSDATRQLVDKLDAHHGETGIVYCASRRRTEELAAEFARAGRRALPYHAGLDHSMRGANQDAFLREDDCIVCATVLGPVLFGHLANILSGKPTEAIQRHGHDQLKTFGVGRDRTPADWRGVLRQLQSGGLIERDWNDRDRLVLTEEGWRVLRGQTPFALREDVVNRRARRRSRDTVAPNDADAKLLAALKALRGAIAAAHKQPAYVIFPDRTLIEMAKERPRGLDELAGIHGVGAVKLQKYGSAFLAVIRDRPDA
jgi:superfamily II DNA helicase RecQ